MAEPQRITLDPDPPQAGKSVKICYDFAGSGVSSTTLGVTYGPNDRSGGDHEVSEQSPCVTITVPQSATSITVTDSAGPSPDKWAPVQ